ncbi:hypothetical protein CDG81_06660 [Actinopolyspora erythraea]|uniref:DUF4878 domain-containing protein n=2 Tax=Actinopolyspora erythraea TaxID=414996 RepID=A0A099D0Q2_9ACTN|nr:hypothetical protein [Actinopolyspora erythraea]ASU80894.1 hypothetical protein CDG81_06660 [Actinopolyspora erythraea]KGI79808.1 hypothetical protein IL38_21690 [Actinopolyspora erythraea]
MPIRTHRGRAAVYRRLWGWPLRSPKHLILALVLLVALVSAVGLLLPEITPAGSTARTDRESTDYAPEPEERDSAAGGGQDVGDRDELGGAPPTISVPTVTPESAPPTPAGMDVVRSWVSNWSRHSPDTTRQQWLDRLRPHTTPEFMGVMESVEPANVPATELTGELSAESSTESSMRVLVPTDGPTLRVHVVRTEQGWRVAGYDRVD